MEISLQGVSTDLADVVDHSNSYFANTEPIDSGTRNATGRNFFRVPF
jgi:hypothetical protein